VHASPPQPSTAVHAYAWRSSHHTSLASEAICTPAKLFMDEVDDPEIADVKLNENVCCYVQAKSGDRKLQHSQVPKLAKCLH